MKVEIGTRRIGKPIEYYILVKGQDERVQCCELDGKCGLLVARSEKAARDLLKQIGHLRSGVSICRVRTEIGETIESHLACSGRDGIWLGEGGEMYWLPIDLATKS